MFTQPASVHFLIHVWSHTNNAATGRLHKRSVGRRENRMRGRLVGSSASHRAETLMTLAGSSLTLTIASPLFLNTRVKLQVKSTVSEPVLPTSHQPVQSRREAWDAPNFHFTDVEIKSRERDVN